MSDYVAVRDNIILKPVHNESIYNRVFVVSAYGGITNLLLEHKKNGTSGVYAEFANSLNDDSWMEAMEKLKQEIFSINQQLFKDKKTLILSGAININNLEQAIKDSNIRFVDVSSSLETIPGKKNIKKINKFLKLATKL